MARYRTEDEGLLPPTLGVIGGVCQGQETANPLGLDLDDVIRYPRGHIQKRMGRIMRAIHGWTRSAERGGRRLSMVRGKEGARGIWAIICDCLI